MAAMKKQPGSQQTVRQRAEVIMKVSCGLMSASQAAKLLGVSRKTYYKWEQRGLTALLGSLGDQRPGRPAPPPADNQLQRLEKQLEQAQRDNALLSCKIALKDVLTDSKLQTGCGRTEKK
jgi:transposase